MSRTIASTYGQLNTIDYRTRSPIRAEDWRALARQQNLLWARFTSEWGGHVFDPPFEAAATDSPVNQSTGRDLNELGLGGIATRPLDSGDYRVGVAAYGNAVIAYDIFNADTSTTVVSSAQINAGASTAQQWRVQTHDLTSAEVGDGSGGAGLLVVQNVVALEAAAGEGDIFQIRAGEIQITSASEIPTS